MIYEPEDIDELYKLIIEHKYAVIYFYAKWCGPCKVVYPFLVEEFNKKNGIDVILIKINIENDDLNNFITDYNVVKVPYLIYFEYGTYKGKNNQFENVLGFQKDILIKNFELIQMY